MPKTPNSDESSRQRYESNASVFSLLLFTKQTWTIQKRIRTRKAVLFYLKKER